MSLDFYAGFALGAFVELGAFAIASCAVAFAKAGRRR